MKNKVLVFLLLLFSCAVQITAQGDTLAFNILKKTKSAIENIKTLRYDVDYHAYSDDKEWDEHKKAKAQIKRVPEDLQFLIQDSLASFSDNGLMYQKILWQDSTLTFMTKEQSKKYMIKAKKDYTIEAYSYINRLDLTYLGILHEPTREVVFDAKPCYKLVFYHEWSRWDRNKMDTTKLFYTYYIDKKSYLIIKEEWYNQSVGLKEIRELYNIEINPILPDSIFNLNLNLPSYITMKPHIADSVRIRIASFEHSKPFLAANTPSPDWELKDIIGNTIRSKDLKGKVVLIDFWFLNCGPCKKAIPMLNQLYADYKDKGLVVLGFNILDLSVSKMQAYKTQYAIDYPLVLCTENVSDNFRVIAAPTFYLIDKEGKVVESHEGFSDEKLSKLSEKINKLLNQ